MGAIGDFACPAGKIELATPIVNPVFADTILKTLRCVCFWCSRLLVPDAHLCMRYTRNPKKRLSAIAIRAKTVRLCPCCGGAQPSWQRNGLIFRRDFVGDCFDTDEELALAVSPNVLGDMFSILDNISTHHCKLLGFEKTKASWLMNEVLPCPPVIMRPSVASSESSRTRGHDDLTLKLQDIVKSNAALRTAQLAEQSASTPVELERAMAAVERARQVVQVHVAMYLTNDVRCSSSFSKTSVGTISASIRRNSNLRSMSSRLKGKRGRIRGNLCGKRVDFSSRSVIGPDPCIDVDELGVPESIATSQTVNARVFFANRESLAAAVRVGANKVGGAMIVEKTGDPPRRISLQTLSEDDRATIAENLQPGDIVHRHLLNGDAVRFGCAPAILVHSKASAFFRRCSSTGSHPCTCSA